MSVLLTLILCFRMRRGRVRSNNSLHSPSKGLHYRSKARFAIQFRLFRFQSCSDLHTEVSFPQASGKFLPFSYRISGMESDCSVLYIPFAHTQGRVVEAARINKGMFQSPCFEKLERQDNSFFVPF